MRTTLWRGIRFTALPLLVLVGTSGGAWAQPKPGASGAPPASAPAAAATTSAAALPPGHPPIDAQQEQGGDEVDMGSGELPPGHPPVGSGAPVGMGGPQRGRTFATDDPSLPAGTIVVQVKTASGKPPVGATVKLRIKHQTVAAGTTTTERTMPLAADGRVRFDGQSIGSDWVYAVMLDYAGVPYEVPMFPLSPQVGKRVEMSVFETTEDIDAALVGVQAFMYIEPQETAFQVEQLFRFSNLSDKTWRCPGLTIGLPRGFKAFVEDDERNSLTATEVSGRGVKLAGFVAPGSTQVVIRYQLPFPDSEQARYQFNLPPRVGHLRVIAAIPQSMSMRVDDLPPPQAGEGNDGRRLQITEAIVPIGGDQFETAMVTLTGLPVPSPTRWYALGLAGLAVLSGVYVAFKQRGRGEASADREAQWDASRKAILRDLEALERARKAGDVGPKTYEQNRRKLIDQLAAILASKQATGGSA